MNAREARQRGAAKSRAKYAAQAAGRREDYAWLRLEQRVSLAEAARRVGVGERQAWRYEAALREAS